jgi:hypothetical protein
MLSEFKNNGYIILRNAFSKELLEYTNSTWDKLKERPFADHFPTVKGEHISASSWELPFQYTNFGSAPFGHYLHISLQAMIEQKLGLELVPTYYFSREYYTDSVLYAHRDRPSCEISATIAIDYKSSTEKAWPIWVKNDPKFSKNKLTAFEVSQGLNQTERELQGCKAIYLEPGDAMIYQGCNVIHWRDPFEGDFSRHTFVHFVNKHGLIFKQFPEIEFDFRNSLSGSYADIEPHKRELMNRVNTLTSYANWSEENACKNL